MMFLIKEKLKLKLDKNYLVQNKLILNLKILCKKIKKTKKLQKSKKKVNKKQ